VIPIGQRDDQHLLRVTHTPTGFRQESLGPVRFVPLVGREGWRDDEQDR
jgi:protein-L-isoaspartate(D-aspartate) O-methyltransferase